MDINTFHINDVPDHVVEQINRKSIFLAKKFAKHLDEINSPEESFNCLLRAFSFILVTFSLENDVPQNQFERILYEVKAQSLTIFKDAKNAKT